MLCYFSFLSVYEIIRFKHIYAGLLVEEIGLYLFTELKKVLINVKTKYMFSILQCAGIRQSSVTEPRVS